MSPTPDGSMTRRTLLTLASAAGLSGIVATPSRAVAETGTTATGAIRFGVNLGADIGPFNRRLLGANANYRRNGGDTMEPGTTQFKPGALRGLKQLGLGLVRFPAGSVANLYDWKRAIAKDLDGRTDQIDGSDGGPVENNLGPREFDRQLDAMGAEGIGMIAWGRITPESASEWVSFMKSIGRPFELWEIGNELAGAWEKTWMTYPAQGDFYDGSGNPIGKPADLNGPKPTPEFYVFGGSRRFLDQHAVAESSFLLDDVACDGSANQVRWVKYPPVTIDADNSFGLSIAGTAWTRVENLSSSGPADHHFTLDPQTGAIGFGDGVNGAIPAAGEYVSVAYTSGPHPGYADYYRVLKRDHPDIKVLNCYEDPASLMLMAEHNIGIDGQVKHYYPQLGARPDDPADRLLRNLDAARMMQERIDEIQASLATAKATFPDWDVSDHFAVYITEYMLDAPQQMAMSGGLEMALITDDHLRRGSEVGASMVHLMAADTQGGMLDVTVMRPKPAGQGVHLHSEHRNRLLQVNVEAMTYQSWTPEHQLPTVTANATRGGDEIHLVITNLTLEPQQVQVGFGAAAGLTLFRRKTLTPRSPDLLFDRDPDAVRIDVVEDSRPVPGGGLELELPPTTITTILLREG